jgi:PncC family amidohydrolase
LNAESLAREIIAEMAGEKLTLATAESITGGGLGQVLTSVAGSSAVFEGGIVSYSDKSKKKFLSVPQQVLATLSAVSESVAITMAEEARTSFETDYAISTTGVAGPGMAYGQKAGTVWIAIASKSGTSTMLLEITGDREQVRHATIESALAALSRILGL